MLDRVFERLTRAEQHEWQAKRLFESDGRPTNWAHAYLQCLGEASRERVAARELVVAAPNGPWADDPSGESSEAQGPSGNIKDLTLGQLLRFAAIAGSAPVRTPDVRRAAQVMRDVAKLMHENKAMARLLWWCGEVEPVPPGRPVIDLNEWGRRDEQ